MLMEAPQTARVGKEKPHESQTREPQPSPPQAARCRGHLSKGQAAIPSGKAALDQLMLSRLSAASFIPLIQELLTKPETSMPGEVEAARYLTQGRSQLNRRKRDS